MAKRTKKRVRPKRVGEQRVFGFLRRGGKRPGAGRPPQGARGGVSHAARGPLSKHHPVHVTLKLRDGLPTLRSGPAFRALKRAFRGGCDRFGFRLNHFAVLSNHVHLIVEAEDRTSLARGMQGLAVRIARALNRLWRRTGRVFADRYHDHVLRSPREVRNALAYVLRNALRHGLRLVPGRPDPYSSGASFDGWTAHTPRTSATPPTDTPTAPARTWLARTGWRRCGRIALSP